jgi:dienelactone hydrolase
MKALVLLLAIAACLSGCRGSSATRSDSADNTNTSPFVYDATTPLHYIDRGVVNHGYPIEVHDVSFTAAGRRVDGFLAVPPGKGPFPAVLYLHGSGGDRSQMIVPASWMAARGVVALTITMPQTPSVGGESAQAQLAADRKAVVATIVAARRAVDALQSLPDVKPDRIGFVGFSAGARIGAILAGVEPRIRALDLLSGGSPPVEEYARQAPAALRPAVRRELGAVDPLRWVARARRGTILLQDGRQDEVVPLASLQALAKAAGPAAEVRWYDQGHSPENAAWLDQLRWLAARLGVGGPVVQGAEAGP